MPIFTRRSRAGSLYIISTRLSNNGPMVTCLGYLDTLLPRQRAGSEGVAAVCSGFCAARDLRAPRRLLHGYETQGKITFPPEANSSWSHSQRAHPLPTNTFWCPRSRTGALELGGRSSLLPLRRPDCTSSRLRAEDYDLPRATSIATL